MTPEAAVPAHIAAQLLARGWIGQDRGRFNLIAGARMTDWLEGHAS